MRKVYFFIISFLAIANISSGQTTYTWVGGATGDYSIATNWLGLRNTPQTNDILLFNSPSAIVVTNVPTETIGAVAIAPGASSVSFSANSNNILTLSAAVPLIYTTPGSILVAELLTLSLNNASPFTMTSGTLGIVPGTAGKISINGGFILSGGTLDFDVTGTGGTTINGPSGSITYNSGTFNSANTSSIIWTSGSNYYHAFNGSGASAIPASSWQNGSTCNITGMTTGTTAPSGLNDIFFSNFNWDCPSQVGNVDIPLISTSTITIAGTLTIKNTGAFYLRFAGATTGNVTAGSYSQTNGNLVLQSAGGANTLSVTGDFSHAGSGTLDGVGNNAAGSATLDLKGNVTKAGTWSSSSNSSSSQMTVKFSGNTTQTVSLTGTWSAPTAGYSNITITNVSGSGVSLTASSVLKVYNSSSAGAAFCNMGGIVTAGGAGAAIEYIGTGTLQYNGSFSQTATAVEFPTFRPPSNLAINNSLGITFPASFPRTIPGTLTMTVGNLALNGNTLSLTNTVLANQLVYTAGYVTTGTLGKYFPTSGLPTTSSNSGRFPLGTGANDRSLYVFFSSTNLSSGTQGMIFVSHTPSPLPPASINIFDNGITLDKRTVTNWTTSTGGFNLGVGGETISLTAVAANIGAVDDYLLLRLTDGVTAYGTGLAPTPNQGTNIVPVTGKSGLTMTDLGKPLYIGSSGLAVQNPLIIITFTWTGAVSTDWTDPLNWSAPTTIGYPSASTEIALITLPTTRQPTIKAGETINVYQLTVTTGHTLSLVGSATLTVYDIITEFSGVAFFDALSTFGYASPATPQTILDLPYGGLTLSGTAAKSFPLFTTVTGKYTITGGATDIVTANINTFIYAGTGAQTITPSVYYNLKIMGSRGGATITLGNGTNGNIIDVKNNFDVTTLPYGTYSVDPTGNIFNFSSAISQTIPGFYYARITNADGPRILDPSGSANPANVIFCRSLFRGVGTYTINGSKVNNYVSGTTNAVYNGYPYYDLTISGNVGGFFLGFNPSNTVSIAGKFECIATNFKLTSNVYSFYYNGTGDQTITAFKTNTSNNTPAFKYSNLIIQGGARDITLGGGGTDTIGIMGSLQAPLETGPYFAVPGFVTINSFSDGKGFNVSGSTVSFSVGSSTIPVLKPSGAGTFNYNNIDVNGGTRNLAGNMSISGNISVNGTDALRGTLNIGDGNTARKLNVLGNIDINGSGTGLTVDAPGQIDLNTGTNGSTIINLAKNLSIKGFGQLMGTTTAGKNNGVIVFNGATPQTYINTDLTYKNGLVNFIVGDGVTSSKLTLLSSMDLIRSATAANIGTLTVLSTDSLDCGIFNISGNGTTGNARFNLNAGAALITANTGGIEGTAISSSTGSIRNDATIVSTYDPMASYVLNASSSANTGFPAATTPFPMANLTIGDSTTPAVNFNLNKNIAISNILTLRRFGIFALGNNDVTLISTASNTASVAAVQTSADVSYTGSGLFNVERNFRGLRRAWYLVTSPLSGTGSIYDTWQISGVNTTTGRGTFVTGTIAGTGTNGLDNGPQLNSSLKAGSALTVVNDTKATLLSSVAASAANKGYFLFVRGDRTTVANYNTSVWNATTLSSRGKIQIGAQTFNLPSAAGYELVGNPYASPVSYTAASKSNVNPSTVWLWDPYLNGTLGGYVTVVLDGSGNISTSTPSPGGLVGAPGQPLILQSSQAFWIQTTSSGASITFNEANKSTVFNAGAFREMRDLTKLFRTNLNLVEPNDSIILADGNIVQFDNQYSKEVDLNDAVKFGNIKEMLAFQRDGKSLSVERRPEIIATDTLFFKLTKTEQRNYQFQFVPTNMAGVLTAFLEDSYTNAKTIVSLNATSTFNFTINGDAGSAAADRFRIVFTTSAAGPLPVTYKSIKAYQQGDNIAVDWTVENEINISKYEVEKSTDGVNFTKVNTTTAKGSSGSIDYSFVDTKAEEGNNFYRILSYNQGGAFDYSRVVVVKLGKTGTGISVYPNPVTGNTIGLSMTNMAQGIYQLRLINTVGQTLLSKRITHATGNSMETFTPDTQLSTGIYQLEVTAPDKRISTIKVIVQ